MMQFVLMIHVLVSCFLIALVLIQQGKGADMGASFGGGASQTLFGSRGSGSFLSHLTTYVVAVFFITSLTLAYMGNKHYRIHSAEAGEPSQSTNVPVTTAPHPKPKAPDVPVVP